MQKLFATFVVCSITATILLTINACKENYTPKPAGYIKVVYPEKKYRMYDLNPAFRFEYPEYAVITSDSTVKAHEGWLNIKIPSLNGIIYLNYKKLSNNLAGYIEDSRVLVYKHTIKAESIDESLILKPSERVYGIFYDIRGNAASSIQFFVTDSIRHFLRGSLYFNSQPNQDSLAPVISFVRKDIEHMIKTLEWK
jgi:gliding motility-associated lipoprotein GldD